MSQNNDRIVSELLYFRIICMRMRRRYTIAIIIPNYQRQDGFLCVSYRVCQKMSTYLTLFAPFQNLFQKDDKYFMKMEKLYIFGKNLANRV